MNVNGVSPHSGVLGAALQGKTRPQITSQSSPAEQGKRPTLSDAAQLFSRLHRLQQEDPEKFREVTAKIADKLHSRASEQSGSDASMLHDIAQLFSQASTSADVSSLAPPPPPKGAMPGLSITSLPQAPKVDIGQLVKSSLEDAGA